MFSTSIILVSTAISHKLIFQTVISPSSNFTNHISGGGRLLADGKIKNWGKESRGITNFKRILQR